jgi:hypothetical protein
VEIAADLAERVSGLDSEKHVVCVQLLDNMSFECKLPNSDCVLRCLGKDGKDHAEAELCVISKDTLRDHFLALQPVFKVLKGFKGIVQRILTGVNTMLK